METSQNFKNQTQQKNKKSRLSKFENLKIDISNLVKYLENSDDSKLKNLTYNVCVSSLFNFHFNKSEYDPLFLKRSYSTTHLYTIKQTLEKTEETPNKKPKFELFCDSVTNLINYLNNQHCLDKYDTTLFYKVCIKGLYNYHITNNKYDKEFIENFINKSNLKNLKKL
jgi:hypothetical protein